MPGIDHDIVEVAAQALQDARQALGGDHLHLVGRDGRQQHLDSRRMLDHDVVENGVVEILLMGRQFGHAMRRLDVELGADGAELQAIVDQRHALVGEAAQGNRQVAGQHGAAYAALGAEDHNHAPAGSLGLALAGQFGDALAPGHLALEDFEDGAQQLLGVERLAQDPPRPRQHGAAHVRRIGILGQQQHLRAGCQLQQLLDHGGRVARIDVGRQQEDIGFAVQQQQHFAALRCRRFHLDAVVLLE